MEQFLQNSCHNLTVSNFSSNKRSRFGFELKELSLMHQIQLSIMSNQRKLLERKIDAINQLIY